MRSTLRNLPPGSLAALLIVVAGLLSFWLRALGEFGPMVVWGRGDANGMVGSAWMQLPLHAAPAVVMAAPRRMPEVLRVVALLFVCGLAYEPVLLVGAAVGDERVPAWGLGATVALIALYGLVFSFGWAAARRIHSVQLRVQSE